MQDFQNFCISLPPSPPFLIPDRWAKVFLVTWFGFTSFCLEQESPLDGSPNTDQTQVSGLDPEQIKRTKRFSQSEYTLNILAHKEFGQFHAPNIVAPVH